MIIDFDMFLMIVELNNGGNKINNFFDSSGSFGLRKVIKRTTLQHPQDLEE